MILAKKDNSSKMKVYALDKTRGCTRIVVDHLLKSQVMMIDEKMFLSIHTCKHYHMF